jgi:hypothetical protein
MTGQNPLTFTELNAEYVKLAEKRNKFVLGV